MKLVTGCGAVRRLKKLVMKTGAVSVVEKTCVDRARKALRPFMTTRALKVSDRLFEQGAKPEAVYFLRSGVIRLERRGMDSSGLCVAHPGDVVGVTFAISGRAYDMDAVVLKTARVEVVEREEFLRRMTESPGLHLEVVRMLSVDLGRCYEVLRTLGPKTRNRGAEEVTL